jgi:DNA-binding GntR family transcriptional regulator
MSLSQAAQPLYHRVYRQLATEIANGALLPGDRLPSERALCDELGVSRATVRRAIEELAGDGLVESRGRGSFVTGDALVEPANTLMSLSELGQSRGLEASARVLAADTRPATLDEADAFGIAPGAELFELRRVRMLDGLPISLDLNRVPLRLVPELVDLDFTRASLYKALDRAGHPAARADYELEARIAEAPAAELLGLAVGAPVLYATTVAFGEDGRVLDLGQTVYRADRYRFQATLMRRVQRERGRSGNEETGALRDPGGRAGGRRRSVRRDARGREA